ncbi:MAG: hypothetical protein HY553_06810, partial [Elusimicrobia bacterium]|nr:hypothetical protein [Elusimicrobiota bacterium]
AVCLTSVALLDPGKWHHVIAVWDPAGAGTQTIYIDGAQNATQGLSGNTGFRDGTKRVTIGNRPFGGTSSYNAAFAGSVDELRVLNRAINAAEAAAHYGSALAGTFAPPPPNQDLRLTIPPNAFSAPVRFHVSNNPQANPLRTAPPAIATALLSPPRNETGAVTTLIAGSIVEFVAEVNGVPFTADLGSPATVALPYADADANSLVDGTDPPINVGSLRVYLLEETPPRWVALAAPVAVDTVTRRVSGRTPHFSVFALFGTSGIGSADEVNVYPVPWRPGSGGRFDSVSPANCNGGSGLCFDKLPTEGTIRIYTITGEQVVELGFQAANANKLAWDGKNAAGRMVASGVYFARVTGFAGASRILKFAIER